MSTKHRGMYCNRCQKEILAVGSRPNHVLHLLLTIATAGFWAIVWVLVALGKIGGYRCPSCGGSVRATW